MDVKYLVSQKVKLIAVVAIAIPVLVVSLVFIIGNISQQCGAEPATVISGPRIFNHNCTDISQIPGEWIAKVQAMVQFQYAHRSHGEQLLIGLDQIEGANNTFSVNWTTYALPTEAGALCIMNGMKDYRDSDDQDYVIPEFYWSTPEGLNRTRDILNNNPTINFTMWTWCTELDGWDENQVQDYLDNISALEAEYPDVIFIYMTGNAQADGWEGYNRYLRNQQIRQYCVDHSEYLFDFEDLDANYNGQQCAYWYEGVAVPHQHPHFDRDETGAHTTYESCELKGAAVWWMFARILGWAGP